MAEFQIISGEVLLTEITGGTITLTTATRFEYTSAAGFHITLIGTGFTYDKKGLPKAGLIASVESEGATGHDIIRGLQFSLTQYCTLALGRTSGSAVTIEPDYEQLNSLIFAGPDGFFGSSGDDGMRGMAGNDTLYGNGGDDWLSGGKGIDQFYGGDGNDGVFFDDGSGAKQGVSVDLTKTLGNILNDGFGNVETANGIEWAAGADKADRFVGNGGANKFYGNAGRDSLYGGAGNDSLDGGAGLDSFNGGAGVDSLRFFDVTATDKAVVVDLSRKTLQVRNDGFGNVETATSIEKVIGSVNADRLTGNRFDNTLWGADGNDILTGGGGADNLYGEAGDDRLFGGAGDDELGGDRGIDYYDGGTGFDTLGFWDVDTTGHGVTVDLARATGQVLDDGYGNLETALNIETVAGSDFADHLSGDAASNRLFGRTGDDRLDGEAGNDYLYGNAGNDLVFGGDGRETMMGGQDLDTLTGGNDDDYFLFTGQTPADWGVDHITDFTSGIDGIVVELAWAADLANGQIQASQFLSGAGVTAATTAAQRLIYNTSTGAVYFDADGTGGSQATMIAILDNHANLTFDRIYADALY